VVHVIGGDRPAGSRRKSGNAREALRLDWLNGDVAELRSAYERACRVSDLDHCQWIEIAAAGSRRRALVHEPTRSVAHDCAIVYFHGGGWIVGSPATHADISGALCEQTGLRVISVDYRLAPEHKAPAPVEDGMSALEFLLADERGPDRLSSAFLCGDSAGGAIAMAVERRSKPSMRERIAGVVSFYADFGLTRGESMELYGSREEGLDPATIERYWALAHDAKGSSPYSIPALQSDSPVPVYLLVCGRDPLRDDSLAMARALRANGRDVAVDMVESATHGFLHDGLGSSLASDTLKRLGRWIEDKRNWNSNRQR